MVSSSLPTFGNGHLHRGNQRPEHHPARNLLWWCVKAAFADYPVTATAIGVMALTADFHRHSRGRYPALRFNDSGDVIAVCPAPSALALRAPSIMAVIAIIARRPVRDAVGIAP